MNFLENPNETPSTRSARFSPPQLSASHEELEKLNSMLQIEAETRGITQRLSRIENYLRNPDGSANPFLDTLVKRRAELMNKKRLPFKARDLRAFPLDKLVMALGPFFSPWTQGIWPYFSEGIDQTPGAAGTSGKIYTQQLFPGGLGFSAPDVTDDGNVSGGGWWIHNWTCSFVFPPAPFNGRLYYRFSVDTSCQIYNAPGNTGSIMEFVTVGATSDVLTLSPFDTNAVVVSGFPVNANLPSGFQFIDAARFPVESYIAVQAGKSAAIGLICGAILNVADGYIQIGWGNFGARLENPPLLGPDVYDKLEYRFESDLWIALISDHLNAHL
jgi:hypothetical protein